MNTNNAVSSATPVCGRVFVEVVFCVLLITGIVFSSLFTTLFVSLLASLSACSLLFCPLIISKGLSSVACTLGTITSNNNAITNPNTKTNFLLYIIIKSPFLSIIFLSLLFV